MKTYTLSLCLLLTVFGGNNASPAVASTWIKQIAEANLQNADITASSLDRVTYTLVDTTAYLMQLGKTGMMLLATGFEDPIGPLFDVVYNTTRVRCNDAGECANETISMEFREPELGGADTIVLTSDFQLDKLSIQLKVGDLTIYCPGYRHTITSNVTTAIRRGERSTFALRNASYGISADYKYVADVGIQVSNVDITLSIAEESWTVQKTSTELENGDIVDDGLYLGDLKDDVMAIWNGQDEGESFETKYEQRAELLLNCALSGGKSSENCEDAKDHVKKIKSLF